MTVYGEERRMELYENERIDYVNDSLKLIQNGEGLTFGTDALLLAGYINGRYKSGIELGGGTGIISMLLISRAKVAHIDCIEVQGEYAELIGRNAEYNSLSERLTAVNADIREYKPDSECEIVFTNPPYMKTESGRSNISDKKNIARHEVNGGIRDFCLCGARMLKYGGAFCIVYRPDRLTELIDGMREAKIEPKRMTFVHANTESIPSMVLIEAKKGGKCGLKVTKPLIIYEDRTNKKYTRDMDYIMENGSFPDEYKG